MNDKAKKVLSYVACALGGAFLGIALLGGLSYCSTSSAREKTDKINTIDRVRHNEQITTQNGGFTGYKFQLSCAEQWLENYQYRTSVYQVDTSNYNLTLIDGSVGDLAANYSAVIDRISSELTTYRPTVQDDLRLIKVECQTTLWSSTPFYCTYISFLGFHNTHLVAKPFILLDNHGKQLWSKDRQAKTQSESSSLFILNSGESNAVLTSNTYVPNGTYWVFQDVESYYKSQGYQDGYESGSSAGYESGYDQGFQEGYMNTYYAFTSLIVNRNAIWSMANIPWHSNNDIYVQSGHLSDYPFLDPAKLQTNTYVNWAYLALFRDTTTLIPYWIYAQRYTTSQNNGYVSFVIRISPADQTSTENAGTIGSYSGGVSLSETSIFQTETVTEWTAPNRCQLIAFGSDDPRDIYRDWFDNGYILPRGIAVDENAYEQGYKQGQLDAQRNTSMNNVFALFTPAFGAVASFFDMKIFGFLPLYWFLIAPLFIALISLIMRMVKH